MASAALVSLACTAMPVNQEPRYGVTYNPYAGVSWDVAVPCVSQHHDHTGTSLARLRAYDAAGYCAVPLMDYSGVQSLAYAARERLWPPERVLEGFATPGSFLDSTRNLRVLFPSAEEVGADHITAAFLTRFIAFWEPHLYARRESWHYSTSAECVSLIRALGGLPVLAHPFEQREKYLAMGTPHGVEVYNAYFRYQYRAGKHAEDYNTRFAMVWDALLERVSTKIFAFAVNDWYGPWNDSVARTFPDVYDSGKTVAFVREATLTAYEEAVTRGAFVAVQDNGIDKGGCPRLERIDVLHHSIHLTTTAAADVVWLSGGLTVARGPELTLDALPGGLSYVRGEIRVADCTVFLQPFTLGTNRVP